MSIDPRGFKTLVHKEAEEFVRNGQVRLNSTVDVVEYSASGVKVILKDGTTMNADYVICTFR